MNAFWVFGVITAYFIFLIVISYFTSRNATNQTFFTANRKSPWYLVAFGMIGTSLSGVTFISVPGEVGNSAFSYFQIVLGYLVGYAVIAFVLLPLYYRLNLITIYTYLQKRFGFWAYKTGSFFFIISRSIGAAFRLFLVAIVLQIGFFHAFHVPFSLTVVITVVLIWVYTFRAGIKTIVWTDTLQTFFMLTAVVFTVIIVGNELNFSFAGLFSAIQQHEYSEVFTRDWNSRHNFFKQFISGALIAIVMTGLDQDMMQKNLTCRNLKEAKKNMIWFSITLVPVNLLFLSLGVLLYIYAQQHGIELTVDTETGKFLNTDKLYPLLALNYFHPVVGVAFLLGIIAAAFSSADSALTALTTTFCIDFLQFEKKSESRKRNIRLLVHLAFSVLLVCIVLVFHQINNDSVINSIFQIAGYTYGPLLGLFAFGLFLKRRVRDRAVPVVAGIAPVLSYILNVNSANWFGGYEFGFMILLVNGLFTFIGLLAISYR